MDDDSTYWQIEMLVGGLWSEFGIKDPSAGQVPVKIEQGDWGGGESDPKWLDSLPEAPPE